MIEVCQRYLFERFWDLVLPAGALPPYGEESTFFGPLPRDFLKENDFAVQALLLQDRKKRDGRLIGRQRDADCRSYTLTRRRYRRELLYRVMLYTARFEDLWGEPGFIGLVDQLEQAVAGTRVLADSGNNAITVELQDAVRPWNSETESDRLRRRPHLAIVRIGFAGGIHTTEEIPIIPNVILTPQVQ
jgi:hypothetical protein